MTTDNELERHVGLASSDGQLGYMLLVNSNRASLTFEAFPRPLCQLMM